MDPIYVDNETCSIADLVRVRRSYFGGVDDALVWLVTRINVPVDVRSRGHGTRLLKRICADADRCREVLFLEPLPSGGLTREVLVAWYERHGFVAHADGNGLWFAMRREPRVSDIASSA